MRLRYSARSPGLIRGHGPSSKARRAAATASSISARDAAGTRPIRSSDRGEITSKERSDLAARQTPSMKKESCSMNGISVALLDGVTGIHRQRDARDELRVLRRQPQDRLRSQAAGGP